MADDQANEMPTPIEAFFLSLLAVVFVAGIVTPFSVGILVISLTSMDIFLVALS